jgi:hypothetical protein
MAYAFTIKEPRKPGLAYEVHVRKGGDQGKVLATRCAPTLTDAYDRRRDLMTKAMAAGLDFERQLQAGEI